MLTMLNLLSIMSEANFNFLKGLEKPVPRYTSYPTVVNWKISNDAPYLSALNSFSSKEDEPLSLYFHIPFCRSICLYCACSVVLNRNPEIEIAYIDTLIKEIDLICNIIGKKRKVTQIHFGGGSPSLLSIPSISRLFSHIKKSFIVDLDSEINMEIDPRNVFSDGGTFLKHLKTLGFNRASLGIQDTNPKVQEAVKRKQTHHQSSYTYELCRELGFSSINIDLIYGLPFQTVISFRETIDHILKMRPDRIAVFSYAKVPWIKQHQKAIQDSWLPSMEEKFRIYSGFRHTLIKEGYIGIGMDHFALENDPLAVAFADKTLIRNFQGYSLPMAENLIGFGITATGIVNNVYIQNTKNLSFYKQCIENGTLPIEKSFVPKKDDLIRKWVIQKIMCQFEVRKKEFEDLFEIDFDDYFVNVRHKLISMECSGLITNDTARIGVTPLGELFIRIIATAFDAYLKIESNAQPVFSQSI